MGKRRCTAKTKAGTPCRAAPLQDRDVCLAHAPADIRESTGFVPDNGKQGRKRRKTDEDLMREWFEEEFGPIIRNALADALKATRVQVTGSGADAFAEVVPDHMIVLRAIQFIHERAFGKPRQQTEITGAGGGPVETTLAVEGLTDEEREAAELLLRRAAGG